MENVPETPKREKPIPPRRVTFSGLPTPKFNNGSDVLDYSDALLPLTPENSSDEISDSESNSDSLLESTDEDLVTIEEERRKIENMTKLAYRGNLEKFKCSLKRICRQLRMLNFVSQYHYNSEAQDIADDERKEKCVKQLTAIQRTIERRTSYVMPHFGILFSLHRFLENNPAHYLIENRKLSEAVCNLIESWLKNPAFHYQNYDKLLYFLRGFYEDESCHSLKSTDTPTLNEIYKLWQYSYYFDDDTLRKEIIIKRDFLGACYFSVILDKFDEKLSEAAYPIPAIIELVNKVGLDFFDTFLRKFRIPFSGPFKSFDLSKPKISYFVSSVNPADSIINQCIPLYGPYAFDLSSLTQLEPEHAKKIWEGLEEIPYWLSYFPPAFNLTLHDMREQLFSDQ